MQNQQMFHSPLCTRWKSGKILSQHLTQFYQSWHWDMFPAFLHFSFTTIFWLLAQNAFTSFCECWFVNKAKIFLNTTVYSICNTLRLLDANPKKMKMTKMKYFVGEASWWASVMKLPSPSRAEKCVPSTNLAQQKNIVPGTKFSFCRHCPRRRGLLDWGKSVTFTKTWTYFTWIYAERK